MTTLSSYAEASDMSVPAYWHGFQTLERETSVAALDVEGRIPDWLTGILLRVGPGRTFALSPATQSKISVERQKDHLTAKVSMTDINF